MLHCLTTAHSFLPSLGARQVGRPFCGSLPASLERMPPLTTEHNTHTYGPLTQLLSCLPSSSCAVAPGGWRSLLAQPQPPCPALYSLSACWTLPLVQNALGWAASPRFCSSDPAPAPRCGLFAFVAATVGPQTAPRYAVLPSDRPTPAHRFSQQAMHARLADLPIHVVCSYHAHPNSCP